jgi:hypothetical protein
MRPLMRFVVLAIALIATGCGSEIGDACVLDSDCANAAILSGSAINDRTCDISEEDGYCTILGCDYDTCPTEAVCVKFFTGDYQNETCDPATLESTTCTLDEECDLTGHCVDRSAEIRYCMRKCNSDGDCRSGYECRDLQLMIEDGGEDVLAPGVNPDSDSAPKFCAPAPAPS